MKQRAWADFFNSSSAPSHCLLNSSNFLSVCIFNAPLCLYVCDFKIVYEAGTIYVQVQQDC